MDENKQLRAERDYAALEYRHEHALRLEIEADNDRLRGLLREWTDMDPLRYDSEYSACPWCEFDYPNMRHEPDCAFVLARAECGIACNHELVTLPQVSDAPICHKCGALEGRD